ncbi:MAG TPA: IS200/IS605 family transposase [Nevskiaceae bacterium]|nr:IS200/IS605 family transposase [Nevskiaceae bacterium]
MSKYRHKCITAEMLARLEMIFADVLEKWRCRLVEFGGEADHVHLLIDAHPALDLSRMIGNLKTVSARRMRQEYAAHLKPYFWKPYFWNEALLLEQGVRRGQRRRASTAGSVAALHTEPGNTPLTRRRLTDDQPLRGVVAGCAAQLLKGP